jgi:hypothetical protein
VTRVTVFDVNAKKTPCRFEECTGHNTIMPDGGRMKPKEETIAFFSKAASLSISGYCLYTLYLSLDIQ